MRWRRQRLTPRDQLNIQVALAAQIEQGIAKVKDAPRQLELSLWARETAGYITTYHQLTARNRDWPHTGTQSDKWAADLCAAITEAVARGGKP